MDHSYRQGPGGDDNRGNRFGGRGQSTPKFFQHADVEPLPVGSNSHAKIFCFIDDLFFLAKINETARKLNIKVEFVKTDQELYDKVNGTVPALIIFDLNNVNAKPLQTIPKLKKHFKRETNIIGFVSHVQGDLKLKAQEAGCDSVLPRSAFSANLPQLLRRHAADEEAVDSEGQPF
jgi:CheY-like chemotaxis protein